MSLPLTPCDQLSVEDRAMRLSHEFIILGSEAKLRHAFTHKPRRPGFCVLCGCRLPLTWRGVKYIPPADDAEDQPGTFSRATADHNPESLARLEEFKAKAVVDAFGLYNGYFLQPVTSCEGNDEHVWQRAKEIAFARHRELVGATDDRQPKRNGDRKAMAVAALRGDEF